MLQRAGTLACYQQISVLLEDQIASGDLPPGGQLPTEQELSRTYEVNRHTVREAIRRLKNDGLVYGIRGKGNFVTTDKINYKLSKKVRFSQTILEASLTPGARLLSAGETAADLRLAARLELPAGARVLVLEILRTVEGLPFSLATSYLPAERFGGLREMIRGSFSLYALLKQRFGIEPSRHESVFEVGMPDTREQDLLQISMKNPLLLVKSLAKDQKGTPVEYVVSRIRGDLGSISINFFETESPAT